MADNVGTPKLEVVISELIQANKDKKFTRFMLSFLLCDISNENIKTFLRNYINEEDSKDILKLMLTKLGFYYDMWYFGNNPQMDSILLELITETKIKLSDENSLQFQMKKDEYKKQIKQLYDAQRKKIVSQCK